ncbi:MAG: tyrosine-type recombinase/integrase [Marmoricola sp.]
MTKNASLKVVAVDGGWELTGAESRDVGLVNDYLGYLGDRHYASGTRRSYAFDLLAFCRWLSGEGLQIDVVDTATLLRFLGSCTHLAPATVNRRLAAISGLFGFRVMRDPEALNPMPRGPAARRTSSASRGGLLGHLARPQPRSPLRARQPRRLPRGLEAGEVNTFLASLRTWRDRAIAGLMLFSGLRSCEVLGLAVADVDIGGGWVRVAGKGGRERRTPVDAEVAGWVQAYLLAERPETDTAALFVVAKGPHRGRPLTPAGLRTVFRYHRDKTGVAAAHPHALRHTFGTALAEAGVDLSVIQSLLGHAHVDSSVGYIHLAPVRVRAAFDTARERQRGRS